MGQIDWPRYDHWPWNDPQTGSGPSMVTWLYWDTIRKQTMKLLWGYYEDIKGIRCLGANMQLHVFKTGNNQRHGGHLKQVI